MSNEFLIQDAERQQEKARIFIDGVSGSGKTRLAVAIASFLAGDQPFGVIDTENRSARKFSGLPAPWGGDPIVAPKFKTIELEPPFSPERYIGAYDSFVKFGVGAIVIDSATHEWSGTGGILEIVDQAQARFGGNKHYAWAEGTPRHNRFLDRCVVRNPVHTIVTARQKSVYSEEKNDRGKTEIKKIGTAPVVREMFEFEFDVQLEIDLMHNVVVSKSRIHTIDGRYCKTPSETLQMLTEMKEWLNSGAVPPPPPEPTPTDDQLRALATAAKAAGYSNDDARAMSVERYGAGPREITQAQCFELLQYVQSNPKSEEKN